MDRDTWEHHLGSPVGKGEHSDSAWTGSAGGAPCGDLITVRLALGRSGIEAGFDAEGCGALTVCASVAAELVRGTDLLAAARIGSSTIDQALGGLPASKQHAVDLVVDALHRALGELAAAADPPTASSGTLVAVSGGVDSAVAAMLCAREGQAAAVTVELWRDPENDATASCCSHVAVRRARRLSHELGLAHFTLDLRAEFASGVVDPWLRGHRAGLTPNPCVTCNGAVRIEPMLDLARRLGMTALATGHYARLAETDDDEGPLLRCASDPEKDQAYALMRVPGTVLRSMRFPLGSMSKAEVRSLAATNGLSVADEPDSQDLCFLAGVGRERFLLRRGSLDSQPGPILDRRGNQLGVHQGHFRHTVGQRRGLGLGGGTPFYVLETDPQRNSVVVGPRDALATRTVQLDELDLRRPASRIGSVQMRHRARPTAVDEVRIVGRGAWVTLTEDAERVAPGQVACLLDGDLVVGSGTVTADGA